MKISKYETLVRSTTGKYHAGMGPNAVNCSSGRRGMRNRPATEKEFEAAPESAFCSKCFPQGKASIHKHEAE